ncbi:MAG TPA: non-ribosomal peptide synthetase [Gammaproteobacteria bacterium]
MPDINSYPTLPAALKANLRDDLSVTFIEGTNNESSITYRQLHERALELLGYFQSQGLRPGDELIFFLKNNAVFIEAFWACLLGGIVPVPVAVGISDEHRSKLMRIFRRLEKPHLLIDRKAAELLQNYASSQKQEAAYAEIAARMLLAEDMLSADLTGRRGDEHHPGPNDLAFIQFSSGSTRDPKGVRLTHANLITNVVDLGNRSGYTPDDISLSWMPLTHDLGLIGFHLNMVVFGMNQNIMATDVFSRRPLLWMQKVSEKRASILSTPNFGLKHYLKMYESRNDHQLDLSCVRIILTGAEPISVGLCHQFLETMARHGLNRSAIFTAYGLAEASLAASVPIPGKEFEHVIVDRNSLGPGETVRYMREDEPGAVKFAVEGPPVDHCGVRIGDADGNEYGADTVGEIQLKGPNVTAGYYNDPESNRELFTPDGWLRTGDLGLMHKGQLVITGRLKDIIFVNGQNYYPHDLEAIALAPGKLELGKVVALGVRNNDSDHDDILVCVLFRGDLKDFLPIAREVKLVLNEQAGLDVTHVLPVQRIPKTTSGKIQRRFFAQGYLQGDYDGVITELAKLQQSTEGKQVVNVDGLSEAAHKIKFICDNILPDKRIGVQDNFFEIGLSSLDLAQIHERIDEFYPGILDITDMFDHPTIEALAVFIESKQVA